MALEVIGKCAYIFFELREVVYSSVFLFYQLVETFVSFLQNSNWLSDMG